MGKFGPTEIILILVIVVLFFGGKKIPELMRGLGKGVKEFKDASKGENNAAEPSTEISKEDK
ncbi:MAG: twin-arginine translocase TatA/TatE family subunit [Flavobacteriia bacterium]|jgi:sec-independent protein translocase protein TatA